MGVPAGKRVRRDASLLPAGAGAAGSSVAASVVVGLLVGDAKKPMGCTPDGVVASPSVRCCAATTRISVVTICLGATSG